MLDLTVVQRLLLIVVLLGLSSVDASSILGFAFVGGRSHQLTILRIGRELTDRGHNFTLLTSVHEKLSPSMLDRAGAGNVRVMTFDGPPGLGTEEWLRNLSRGSSQNLQALLDDHLAIAYCLHADASALQHLKDMGFDLLLRDATFWPAAVLQDMLAIPSVDVLPMSVLMPLNERLGVPNSVAYIPQMSTPFTPGMACQRLLHTLDQCMLRGLQTGLMQRLQNYLTAILIRQVVLRKAASTIQQFARNTGQRVTGLDGGPNAAAAVIATVDFALEYPIALPPIVQLVGPVLCSPAKPLPQDLSAFLSHGSVTGHEAVYVSMGSAIRLNAEELHAMAEALSNMPNPILWKLPSADLPGNVTIESLNLTSNIQVVDWAPQNDVLGHPAVVAFVTQAGSHSTYEAAYHAVPMVAVPLMADQINNAVKAEYHGFGVIVQPGDLIRHKGASMRAALQQVMSQPHFKVAAVKVQTRLRSKSSEPVKVAADVAEHVMATKGEMYLNTHEHKLTWWQLSLLDVRFVLLLAIALVVGLLVVLGRTLFACCKLSKHRKQH